MNSRKYYTDNLINYQQGNGTLYYTPNGGTPDTHTVNWMSTVNFSRTNRTKGITIALNSEGGLLRSFTINQSPTEIAILLDDIEVNGESFCNNGNTNGVTEDVISYKQIWSFDLGERHLGKTGYIIVLINGNVIDASLEDQDDNISYPITGIGLKECYKYSIDYYYPTYTSGNNNPELEYQRYPTHINNKIGEVYKLDNISGYHWSKPNDYDTITEGNNGKVTTIEPNSNSLCFDETYGIYDYGKNVGLIAIKIPFDINSQTPSYDSENSRFYRSCINIKTAVFDKDEDTGVNSNEDEYRQITIYFGYTDSGASLDDIDDLQFDPAGESDGSHNPEVTINSNRPWTVVP